jgi:hypothetical protein
MPRIDDGHAEIVEMPDVASCERSALCQCDTGDHGVAKVTRLSGAMPCRHDQRCLLGCMFVEGQYATFELVRRYAPERRFSSFRRPVGMSSKPKRISDSVTAVVQTEARDWRSSQAIMFASALMAAESTLVSRIIISRIWAA